jgi:hypothetical protein
MGTLIVSLLCPRFRGRFESGLCPHAAAVASFAETSPGVIPGFLLRLEHIRARRYLCSLAY